MTSSKNTKKFEYKLIINNFLIYLIIIGCFFLISKGFFIDTPYLNEKNTTLLYSFLFSVIVLTCIFALIVEYNFNKLNFKSIFLIIGLILILNNTIAILILPSSISLPNTPIPLLINTSEKIYGFIYGLIVGLTLFLFYIIFSKKITNTKFLIYFFELVIAALSIIIIISFFVDFDSYIYTIKNKFTDSTRPVCSILGHKNNFADFLLCGSFSALSIYSLTKNKKWLIFLPIFFIISLFTFAKTSILLNFLLIVFFLIFNIIKFIKNDKNNIVITIYILILFIFLLSVFIVLIFNSESGFLFTVKKAIINIKESASSTFKSRLVIWDCTLKLLKPVQYIFGFGMALVGKAINLTYTYDPRLSEDPKYIYHAHNALIEIIAEGGVIFLIVYASLIVYLIYCSIKIIKKNKLLGFLNLTIIIILLLRGITDPIILFSYGASVFYTAIIVIPIIGIYNYYFSKECEKEKNELCNEAEKIKNIQFKNILLRFNKYLINLIAYYIKSEKN